MSSMKTFFQPWKDSEGDYDFETFIKTGIDPGGTFAGSDEDSDYGLFKSDYSGDLSEADQIKSDAIDVENAMTAEAKRKRRIKKKLGTKLGGTILETEGEKTKSTTVL